MNLVDHGCGPTCAEPWLGHPWGTLAPIRTASSLRQVDMEQHRKMRPATHRTGWHIDVTGGLAVTHSKAVRASIEVLNATNAFHGVRVDVTVDGGVHSGETEHTLGGEVNVGGVHYDREREKVLKIVSCGFAW